MKRIQLFDIKTRTLGFAFCQPQKKSLPKSHPKKVATKFQTQKQSSDRNFQTQKRASHIPVTYIPEYPPPPPPPGLRLLSCPAVTKLGHSASSTVFRRNNATSNGGGCNSIASEPGPSLSSFLVRWPLAKFSRQEPQFDKPAYNKSPTDDLITPTFNYWFD